MQVRQLFAFSEPQVLSLAVAAGVDGAIVTTPTEIDTLGYDSVAIVYSLGAIAASGVITTSVRNSATSGSYGSGTVDRVGNALANNADTDDNRFIIHEIHRPSRRFLRTEYQRTGGNVAINGIFAILFNRDDNPAPLSQVEAIQFLNSPTPSAT
jgi:hypothetical protein